MCNRLVQNAQMVKMVQGIRLHMAKMVRGRLRQLMRRLALEFGQAHQCRRMWREITTNAPDILYSGRGVLHVFADEDELCNIVVNHTRAKPLLHYPGTMGFLGQNIMVGWKTVKLHYQGKARCFV